MADKPTLKITYDNNGRPMAARCSCGESMTEGEARITDTEALKKWFETGFEAHVRHKHAGEDGNESAQGRA